MYTAKLYKIKYFILDTFAICISKNTFPYRKTAAVLK